MARLARTTTMMVRAEEFIREGALCYLDIDHDGQAKVGRLYYEAVELGYVSDPLTAVAARDIERNESVEYDPAHDTADLRHP